MRYIDPDLLDCLRRPDSYTEYAVELTAPDVSQVLRRQSDQFFSTPPSVAGTATGGAFAAAATGGMQLASTPAAIATFLTHVGRGELDLKKGKPTRALNGVAWTVDPTFQRAVARSFTARILKRNIWPLLSITDWQLQVYRITRTPGVPAGGGAGSTVAQSVFTPLLSSAPVIKAADVVWAGDETALTWDLSAYALTVEATPTAGINPGAPVELPVYFFVVEPLNIPDLPSRDFEWLLNTTTPQAVAGIGTFARQQWSRSGDEDVWASQTFGDTPVCTLTVDAYPATGAKVYAIDLGRAPSAGTVGRVVFDRQLPRGTAATLELATASVAGPWSAVQAGDVVAIAQQLYWMRLTLAADTALHSTPIVNAFGVEFRIPYDIGDLTIASTPPRDIAVPFLEASIAEASLRVLRMGERDYLDPATVIGSTAPTSKLEVDIYLRSRHPLILGNRSKWLHLERLSVTDRDPGETSESLQLLSYSKNLAVKLPAQVESINTVHTVQAGTTELAVLVAPPLTSTTSAGNEYDGKQYYLRVRSTSSLLTVGYSPVIAGNTGTGQLDFAAGVFPFPLLAGDVVEVHSGITITPTLKWQDADPADIWEELLAQCPNVTADRIGRGDLPRSGRPPRLTDRFPADPDAQAAGTLSLELKDQNEAGKLIDQVSFHLGGSTIELGGQICFVQIYPLTDADGAITVPTAPVAAVFDVRDIVGGSLKTKPNVASRLAVVSSKYGVNNASADPSQYQVRMTRAVDADAVEFLSKGDLAFIGAKELSDDLNRWLYNSADLGLFMASASTRQVCLSCSTGIRVFPWQTVDAFPELTLGDSVIVVTDQYTDYDPSRRIPLAGWLALRGVLVHVGPDGRDFAMFVQGLLEGAQQIAWGGAGTALETNDSRLESASLQNVTYTDDGTTATVHFDRGRLVEEIWAAYAVIDAPEQTTDFATKVAPSIAPLAAGATSFVVPMPADEQITLVQIEPRLSDLAHGHIERLRITATPQPPIMEPDDRESDTTGTQWLKLTERGIKVLSVEVQTQIGASPFSDWGPPARSAGATSLVRGGILGALEFEHDVDLDANRQSWIGYRAILDNGKKAGYGPFGFDRDKNPNLGLITVVGSMVNVPADVDTQSVTLSSKTRPWSRTVDGASTTFDVSLPDDAGNAGLAAVTPDTFTASANSDPKAYLDGSTLVDRRDVLVSNGAPAPASSWLTVIASAPAIGDSHVAITLKVSTAQPTWSVALFIGETTGGGNPVLTNRTADVSPALTAPPTVDTVYAFPADHGAVIPDDISGDFRKVRWQMRADLKDNTGTVIDTRTVNVIWMTVA